MPMRPQLFDRHCREVLLRSRGDLGINKLPPVSRDERWEGLLSFIDGNMAGFFV